MNFLIFRVKIVTGGFWSRWSWIRNWNWVLNQILYFKKVVALDDLNVKEILKRKILWSLYKLECDYYRLCSSQKLSLFTCGIKVIVYPEKLPKLLFRQSFWLHTSMCYTWIRPNGDVVVKVEVTIELKNMLFPWSPVSKVGISINKSTCVWNVPTGLRYLLV